MARPRRISLLTDAEDRRKYIELMKNSVKSGGHLIIATFAPDGPLKCSGLEVVRYSPESLIAEMGDDIRLKSSFEELHNTPFGTTQAFVYSHLIRT